MNNEELQKLHEGFDTSSLLDAVGHVDELRVYLNDREHSRPPEIRDDLLKLHKLVIDGQDADLKKMVKLAFGIEDEVLDMLHHMEALYDILSKLTGLVPESIFDSNE